MSLENLTGPNTGFNDLVPTNPDGTDPVSEGDNHIRGVKNVTVNVLGPMVSAAVSLPGSGNVLAWDGAKYAPTLGKGVANGFASLDATGKVPVAQLAGAVITLAPEPLNGLASKIIALPVGTKRVWLGFERVSTTGSNTIYIRPTSGGVPVTTGYACTVVAASAASAVSQSTQGFTPLQGVGAAATLSGNADLAEVSAGIWSYSSTTKSGTGSVNLAAGEVPITSFDGIQIITADAFDAGNIRVSYV